MLIQFFKVHANKFANNPLVRKLGLVWPLGSAVLELSARECGGGEGVAVGLLLTRFLRQLGQQSPGEEHVDHHTRPQGAQRLVSTVTILYIQYCTHLLTLGAN